MLEKLDPEYIALHEKYVLHLVPPETKPWDPAIRDQPAVPGGAPPISVGSIEDFDLPHAKLRAYFPEGNPPEGGWPVLIYFHGGAFQPNLPTGRNSKE